MKILYCITRSDLGGAQVHLFDLIQQAKKQKIDCEVVIGEKGELYNRIQEIQVPVHYQPTLVHPIKPLTDLIAVFDLYKTIRKVNPTLIHLHSTKAGWIGRLAGKLARKPVIFTAHGWSFTTGVKKTRRITGVIIEKIFSGLANKIICVSEYDRQLALRYKVSSVNRLITIYNGVSASFQHKEIYRDKGPIRLGMVARFSEQKDQDTLVRAISEMKEDVEVYFIGDGPRRNEIEKLAEELNVSNRIFFLGECSNVKEQLLNLDVFVLSSNYEGLPISIIEAMASGLPIIASEVGGVSELVIDNVNGYLIPTRNPQALKEAIEKIYYDRNLIKQFGVEARKQYERFFTLEQCSQRTVELYEEVAQYERREKQGMEVYK